MTAEQEIRNSQQHWAKLMGIPFDSLGYVPQAEDNLWQPLSGSALQAFERGAGKELSGHMKALHSSSALAVNFFDYWTCRDKTPLLSALGIEPVDGCSLDFEAQFRTGLGGTPPHTDVALTDGSHFVHAIEAKFTEHLKHSSTGKSDFKSSYFPKSRKLWDERGLSACQKLAEDLSDGRHRFEYLDPWQLLKHALGLATQKGDQFSLYYIYYDWFGEELVAHRREIDLFEERVGCEVRFRVLTYQQVFKRFGDSQQAGVDYLNYLKSRYFPPVS